ncbi:ABC transporter permease [Variovorax sp. NFACC27]|jgi:peptide/nickel transport system permease protein|uniref:ABC transporter permease n=1 Tax=Variovorax TaxID=34072 RepID=UPI00036AD19A|nr:MULTISPECIES: ABC transporter permease [Variovorax]SEF28887.1 peptide/nickel transport system permease protein [Variovorax sp. NFACC28]SEG80007.1 peptide/nickel transport system permease protein [Variovorax sp. NFACC29]SFC90929.1 peptide/nickel transport system permease protein [Variovorax sp. NFACC26]SFG05402.1 peptide/nickel transport system permease protein [Variovorax sp. NFACC27]MBB3643443.1 peptide/nickel transport system permease protein [Variovorax sp. BK613]
MKSKFWRRFSRNKGAVFGLIVLMLVALVTALGPFVAQNNPWDMVGTPFAAPMAEQGLLLGTDTMGRDILSGIVTGARVSLLIGVVSTVVSLLIGVSIGAVSGYFGGWIDATLMRFTELFQAIPSFALAIVLVAIFQPSVQSIVTAIAIVSWPPVARLVRSEFLTLRQRDFVAAAQLAGQSTPRIILTQILPNAASPIVVMASLMVATAILLESSLSFLGLGDPNQMSWGYMVGSARTVLRQAWWMAVFPGVAILLTVLALNLVGEGLNDGLNARADGRGK